MMRPKNQPIGLVSCPVKGCEEAAHVYKFRARQDQGQRRLAGKLYGQCPTHGRFGADGKAAIQDYILERAEIWPEGKKADAVPVASSPAAPTKPQSAPAQSDSSTASAPPPPKKPPTPPPAPVKPEPPAKRPPVDVWDL